MKFYPHPLEGTLGKYIDSMFYYHDFFPDHSIERVVPTGHVHLIFELDGFVRNTFDNETLQPQGAFTRAWVSGSHKNYISISAHQKSEMFVIRFKPFGAYPFFKLPICELNNQILPAEKIWGAEVLAIREQLRSRHYPAEKFQVAEAWLNQVFKPDIVPAPELLEILEKLEASSVSEYPKIMAGYPMTQKHLIDQFKKYVGLTPKYYQRIRRFNEILQQINQAEKIEWSQIAYQCEYSDQSHFIKEFRHFSGINPQIFIRENYHNYGDNNFFPLDWKG
ncbi:MAG: AraC family transcriptional regulator [Bacteroidota bacterium]